MIVRGFRYKLVPTKAQKEQFRQFAGDCRLIYNLALKQRRDHWCAFCRQHNQPLGYVATAPMPTQTLRSTYCAGTRRRCA